MSLASDMSIQVDEKHLPTPFRLLRYKHMECAVDYPLLNVVIGTKTPTVGARNNSFTASTTAVQYPYDSYNYEPLSLRLLQLYTDPLLIYVRRRFQRVSQLGSQVSN